MDEITQTPEDIYPFKFECSSITEMSSMFRSCDSYRYRDYGITFLWDEIEQVLTQRITKPREFTFLSKNEEF